MVIFIDPDLPAPLQSHPVPPSRTESLSTHLEAPRSVGTPWTAQLTRRARRYFWLKTAGISLFMWIFFVGYFHVLRNPLYPVIEMPLTALDHVISFQPMAVVPYLSLWLYVSIPPGLMLTMRQLFVYGFWIGSLCLVGLAIFYWVPTAVPPLAVEVNLADHPAFALLQGADAAGNACPSLHVATAAFSVIWIEKIMRDIAAPAWLRALNAAWFLLIVHSTLAIKQHVVLDVVAGAALGAIFAIASLRWRPSGA